MIVLEYPVRRDRRYTVARECAGHLKPVWVARFCGEWIGCSMFRGSAYMLAVGHHAKMNGAPVIEERRPI